MMWNVPEELSLIVSGGRGPFRRGLDLTHRDTFRFHLLTGWTEISQTATEAERANRSTEAVPVRKQSEKHKTTAYAFSGSSSTLPAFVNRPDGLQKNLVRYKKGWKIVAASPVPRARSHHPLAYSKQLHALFIYGKYTNDAVNSTGLFTPENYLGDLWQFDIDSATWAQLVFDEDDNGPGHRDNAKLIIDEHQDRIWLFGGGKFDGTTLADVWYFDLHAGV